MAFGVHGLKAGFAMDIENDHQDTGQSDGQPQQIDSGIEFLAPEMAHGDQEVICKHCVDSPGLAFIVE